jgi:predicted O-linked N-acetylglucosamine transferase (SPINDLY family)
MMHPDSDRAETLVGRGVPLHQSGRLDEARLLYEEALRVQPRNARALRLLSLIALQRNEPERAVALIGEALRIDPQSATGHSQRGNALLALGQSEAAIASYDRAIELKGDFAEAFYNRGSALLETRQYARAIDSFDSAIAHKPDYLEAHYNRGFAFAALDRHAAAIASYDRAIALRPNFATAHASRALALFWLNDYEAAIASYDNALAAEPNDANTHYNRGNALRAIGHLEAAVDSYDRALALDPDFKFLPGLLLHAKMQMCSWDNFPAELEELTRRIERGQAASPPLPVLSLIGSPAVQRRVAQLWISTVCPPNGALAAVPKTAARDKIRIGYFSADFREHAVSILMAGVFEAHDRNRFEVTAFSFGPDTRDATRRRLEGAFDRFVDVRQETDHEIALRARAMNIDIAVDLGGFTEGCRTNIFAMRAAPLQVSYIGYLGTMAAPYMDYLIADPTIIPFDHREHYSEKIIYLPSYQANDADRVIADRQFTRAELGLPAGGFVFCCFNSNFKVTPAIFESWMRILARVPGSVLLLYVENQAAAANLRREATRRGIDSGRIIFAARLPGPQYLARYRAADLFLDTLPCNAGTTASDALWAGLPVLTRIGEGFAGRVAASLLHSIGLPELITSTQEEYEALAVDLASNPALFATLKERLAANRHATRLFDTRRFTRDLEAAYSRIHERWLNHLPPDHIVISDTSGS